jgi:hypothetical protein
VARTQREEVRGGIQQIECHVPRIVGGGKGWQDKALERLEEMGLISDVNGAKLVDLENGQGDFEENR